MKHIWGRNPFFIRDRIRTRIEEFCTYGPDCVAIPSSSGIGSGLDVAEGWRSGRWKQFSRNPFFIRDRIRTAGFWMTILSPAKRLSVAIPSSSGIGSGQAFLTAAGLSGLCRNPFFIRDRIRTDLVMHHRGSHGSWSQSLLHQG